MHVPERKVANSCEFLTREMKNKCLCGSKHISTFIVQKVSANKAHHIQSTFGSSAVKKVHAIVAPRQKAKIITFLDQVCEFRCRCANRSKDCGPCQPAGVQLQPPWVHQWVLRALNFIGFGANVKIFHRARDHNSYSAHFRHDKVKRSH